MPSSDDTTLERERHRLERGDHLRWTHWFVLWLSLVFTLFAWRYSIVLVERHAQVRFERHAAQVIELVQDRIEHYADTLRGSASFLTASDRQVSPAEWATYTATLRLDDRFPALRAFGIAYRVPVGERAHFERTQRDHYPDFDISPSHGNAELLPVSLIWPANHANAVGLDLAWEPGRREAAQRAVATGDPQLTDLVPLGVSGKPGLVLMNAFSHADDAAASAHDGVAMAVILATELLHGLGPEQGKSVSVHLADRTSTVYEDGSHAALVSSARFVDEHLLDVYGRDWTFDIRSTAAFDRESMLWLPTGVLIAGLLVNALMLTLFLSLSRSRRQALQYARLAGQALHHEREELAIRNGELSSANAELERFGYALSHDLKTPLRGIHTLVGFAEDDLADMTIPAADREGIEHHLQRVRRQITRGTSLIEGMLEYSGLDGDHRTIESVNVRDMLHDIADGLQLGPDRFHVPDTLPILQANGTCLNQVFSNLIGNAVKYHPSPDDVRIAIEVSVLDDMVHFAVDDNGEGIAPRHRAQVFDLFGKAHSRSDIDSSGIGLSIVKKSVERVGGTVAIEDAASGGARFVFTWPRVTSAAA